MRKQPLVSIVIPSYNHARFIAQTIQSVLDQTHKHIEVIIVDDASTDDSLRIIKSFKDSRLTCITNPKNQGISATINTGIRSSKGEYIATLGSDDLFVSEKISRQVQYLQGHPEVAGVFTYAHFINQSGEEQQTVPQELAVFRSLPQLDRKMLLKRLFEQWNVFCAPSSLVRASIYRKVGLYDERLLQLQDYDMWIRILLKHDLYVIPEQLTQYRLHTDGSNISSQKKDHLIRTKLEQKLVLERYLSIDSFAELVAIFPNLSQYQISNEKIGVQFALANAFLNTFSNVHQFIGIELLYKLMGSKDAAQVLKEQYNFDYPDLYKTVSQRDIFDLSAFHGITTSSFFKLWQLVSRFIRK